MLAQGILANELSLAPSAFLIWIALVFCALSQVARPSPTASRRSLEQHDQQRLEDLQAELNRRIVALRTVREAWLLISVSGAVSGLIAGGALWVITAVSTHALPGILMLVPSSLAYGAASSFLSTYLLRPISVRKFVQSRLARVLDALPIVILAASVGLAMATVAQLAPGTLGVTVAASIGILWLAPMLNHMLVVSRSASYLVLRMNTVRSQLALLTSNWDDLVAQSSRTAGGDQEPPTVTLAAGTNGDVQ